MTIVNKSTKDLIPKVITHMILNSTKKFINEELLVQIYSTENQVSHHKNFIDQITVETCRKT